MVATSKIDDEHGPSSVEHIPPGLISKDSDHPVSAVVLGEVVAVQFLNDGSLLFFYADKHTAKLYIDGDSIVVSDHEVPSC